MSQLMPLQHKTVKQLVSATTTQDSETTSVPDVTTEAATTTQDSETTSVPDVTLSQRLQHKTVK